MKRSAAAGPRQDRRRRSSPTPEWENEHGFSVNTNVGALAALQSLGSTNKAMAQTQSRSNSGYNVASTKDDSAAYAMWPTRPSIWAAPSSR